MTWVIKSKSYIASDPDARAYILGVEAADGQTLEPAVRTAIDDFVVGCKADGIWDVIKASCILAGARTLAGALVPLVGTAPTNNNFVSADYNRKAGLKGDGSTKYLDTNRSNSAEPQNSRHIAFYASALATNNSLYVSTNTVNTNGDSYLYSNSTNTINTVKLSSTGTPAGPLSGSSFAIGFSGAIRSSSTGIVVRRAGVNVTDTVTGGVATSSAPLNQNLQVFGSSGFFSNARIAFYSIGTSTNLAQFDTRVTTLINIIAAAIP